MTSSGKATELRHWADARHEAAARLLRGEPLPGGHGWADPPVYALCDRLNALPFLCTLQSCAGHRLQAADGSGEYVQHGQIWLWLDRDAMEVCRREIALLVANPLIERVRCHYIMYNDGVREVLDIMFHGLEHGPDSFARSESLVGDFLCGLRV